MSVSAVDCVQPAIQHTRQQIFTRFRFSQWLRLALVGILAGELYVGSCGFGNLGNVWQRPKIGQEFVPASPFGHIDPARIAQFAGLIVAAILLAIVLFFVFLYINSVFRFILFDSVLRRECSIGDGWQRWHHAGRRYFLWQLVLAISSSMFLGLLIGVPLMMMGASGWTKDYPNHLAGFAGRIVLLITVTAVSLLAVYVVKIFGKDFLVPVMALEDLDFADGWSRLLALMRAEPGAYVVYILLKIAMTIAAMILFTIAALFPILIVAIPSALVFFAGGAVGLSWSVATVSLTVIFGTMAFLLLIYLIACVSVPATVFFPAYAMYFFAARYPNLGVLLNPAPAPPTPEVPPVPEMPPPFPPPLPPEPEPIG